MWDGQDDRFGWFDQRGTFTKVKDKIPVLGDLPLVGRLFRSESSSTKKKNLMIFCDANDYRSGWQSAAFGG